VTRWTRRLLFGAVVVLVPALAGCEAGYNAPTLTFHPASTGQSTIVDGIAIDNAFVLGPQLNTVLPAGGEAGLFMSLSSPNDEQLTSISAPGAASSVRLIKGPVTLSANTLVSLDGPAPEIVLSGLTSELSGGETVQLVLNFSTVGAVTILVPVEPNAYDFATYAPPPPSPTPTPNPKHKTKPSASSSPGATPTGSVSATPTASASPSVSP
jgi:copper(I)-binding protein